MVKAANPCNMLAGTQGPLAKGISVPLMHRCHLWCNHHEPCDPLGYFLDQGIRHTHITLRLISTWAVSGHPHGVVFALRNFPGVRTLWFFKSNPCCFHHTTLSFNLAQVKRWYERWLAQMPIGQITWMRKAYSVRRGPWHLDKSMPDIEWAATPWLSLLPHRNVDTVLPDQAEMQISVHRNLCL